MAAALICLAAVLGLFINAKASGSVTVSGTNVFTASGEASVLADRQENTDHKEGEDEYVYYTMFAFAYNDDAISYRRNLAYNWFARESTTVETEGEDGKTETTTEYGNVEERFFNMVFGLKNTSFEKFVVRFESQQYVKTKDSKSQNYVIFYPHTEAGKVYAVITTDEDAELDVETAQVINADKIAIKFTGKYADDYTGGYNVYVGNGSDTENYTTGKFENVGGNYAKASTSSTAPVYPLTFKAVFDEEETDKADRESAQMVLYSLNGQKFELSGTRHNTTDDYYYGGTVTDNTPAVLCLEEQLNFFTLGESVNVDYAVIDVLRTSPRPTLNYYVLTYKQYTENDTDYNDRELFKELSSSDIYYLEPDRDKYYPASEAENTVFADENLKADMAVKVYFTLTDISSNSETDYVYLDWYLNDDYKLKINGADFIAVAKDTRGATYNYDGADGKNWEQIKADYQAQVDKAAKNLTAGSSSYLYLPSVESLFAENGTAYTDMKFSIYYYGASQLSNTNLSYNNLSINVTRDDKYVFTVYATDASGNNMYYLDEDGEVVEFAASEIWKMFEDEDEEGLAEKLPWFEFKAKGSVVHFEEQPGMQATAYVGTSYTPSSFKINGISGYKTNYRLFLFDRAAYYADHGNTLNYSEFLEKMDELFDGAETRGYFTEIPAKSSMKETDPDYDKYADYEWNNTSLNFVPQDNNAFYMIRAEVTDGDRQTDKTTCNMGIVASVKSKTLKGESDWLKNNVASVVLLSVAGLALVGIILLLVIKPKNKGDLDEQFEAVRSKKKLKK